MSEERQTYEKPEIEYIEMQIEDIVCTSTGITCEGVNTPIDCFFDF